MSILDILNALLESKLVDIGRGGSMAWLVFRKKKGAEYSLHLQCPFRFERNNEILVARDDIFYPNTSSTKDDCDFDWDIIGNNLYDEKVLQIKNKYYVKECIIGKFNDLIIRFTDNVVLYCFSNNACKAEQWRFFEAVEYKTKEERYNAYEQGTNKKHLVVTSVDYELV